MNIQTRIYYSITKYTDKIFTRTRYKKLNNRDFSIICNNCWGGYVYRRFGIPYLTPTIGLYFFGDDFIKLCADLRSYMEAPLEFIPYTRSRYKELLELRKHTNVPIAKLKDIEIIFLHYKTPEEAREKWERRAKRINYDNLIFKFSKMNLCTEQALKDFDVLEVNKKICFLPPEDAGAYACGIPFKSAAGLKEIEFETAEYARYIDLTRMINAKNVCGEHME